jgi:FAD/FMN-containing dehydrogenase
MTGSMPDDLTRREALGRGGQLLLGATAAPAAVEVVRRHARRAQPNWERLAHRLRGSLVRPGQSGYRRLSAAENYLYEDVMPRGIALCADARDIQTCVRWATENHVPMVARSGGHSFGGYSRTTGLQIDLRRMKSITVDAKARTMRVTGAVDFADLDAALKPYDLFIPAGQCPPVAVNGFTHGGGFGFYSRAHGLAVDQLRTTDVVLASGDVVTADADKNADLFWACRGGGGGNFGINASMTFELFPVGDVSVCKCIWSADPATVLRAFQALFPTLPDDLALIVRITPPDRSATPGPVTVTAFGHLFGPSSDLRDLLAPVLRAAAPSQQQFLDLDFWKARDFLADLSGPPNGYVERSRYVDGPMSDAGVATILDHAQRFPGGGATSSRMDFWLWGGAMNRPAPQDTAFVHRTAQSLFAVGANWPASMTRRRARPLIAWVNDTWRAVGPHATGYAYQNFIDPALEDWEHAYYGANLARLKTVKRAYDPHDRFRFAQSIPG